MLQRFGAEQSRVSVTERLLEGFRAFPFLYAAHLAWSFRVCGPSRRKTRGEFRDAPTLPNVGSFGACHTPEPAKCPTFNNVI